MSPNQKLSAPLATDPLGRSEAVVNVVFARSQFALEPLHDEHSEILLRWRNTDFVRESMFNDRVISSVEHRQWFAGALQELNVRYRIFYFDGRQVGLVYFTQIDLARGHCFWGFYLGETNLPRGIGTALGYCALNDVFATITCLQEITGEVLTSNLRSLALHNKLGFVPVRMGTVERNGKLEEFSSLVLSREAWSTARPLVAERLFGDRD